MFQSKSERAKSYFYNMRKFHNKIKRLLYDKYANNISSLLDLACGKGGDLSKWVSNNIKNVVGYDINESSIKEAKRRVNEFEKSGTKVELCVKDLSTVVIKGNEDFDVITSMFAFHYFFESQKTFDTIMTTIDNNLKGGGYFMGAMFDGKSVQRLLNESNGHYRLDNKFEIVSKTQTSSLFGNRISVLLKDTVLDEPTDEFIVDFDEFVQVMKTRGYSLIETKMFGDRDFEKHAYGMNTTEKVVSFLNRLFVFKKDATWDQYFLVHKGTRFDWMVTNTYVDNELKEIIMFGGDVNIKVPTLARTSPNAGLRVVKIEGPVTVNKFVKVIHALYKEIDTSELNVYYDGLEAEKAADNTYTLKLGKLI